MAQAVLSDSFQEFGAQAPSNGIGDPQQFLRSKKRADNYSRKDKERLIKLVTSRLDILENKVSNTCVNLQKAQCWVEIANEYNEGITISDNWRDDRQLKDLWKRMKFTARSDLIRHARQKERKTSSRNNNNNGDDDNTRGSSSSPAQDILDDFTVILLRLVPAHFQMDTDGKVLQVIDELLALSPDEVEQQKVLSRNRRQERRQQMTGYYGNPDDDDDDDDNAVVLLEVNNTSPDDKSVVIIDSCLPPLQGPNNTNPPSSTGTQVATGSEHLNSNPQEKTFYTETVLNPQSTTTVAGGILHRPQQVIDIRTGIDNSQLQRQPQISSQPLLPPLVTSSTNSLQQPTAPSLQQQQTVLHEEPIFTCKTENDTSIINDTMNDTSRQNWYIEQIGSQNQFADTITDTTLSNIEKDYQYRRKRKNPFYRALLDEDRSEDIQQQLIEIARKENEKEMQLIDAQMQCEKQRLVREKIETENAVLKQRLLLQLLQSQNNKDQGLPSISLLL